jgi:hypothetical protein
MSARIGVVACGALAASVRRVARRRGWDVDVHPVPALLHNRPERIGAAVARRLDALRSRYDVLAVAYGDCGTHGALDSLPRLRAADCYELYGGEVVERAMRDEPGTYFLTDFLARTFERAVWRELGLDRHPDLLGDYFGHYRRVVWLAQIPSAATRACAERAAAMLGLPLEVRDVGDAGLERELARLMEGA